MSQQSTDFLRLKRAILALEKMQAKLDAVEYAIREPIAIIGMGCRFPGGANDPESFWQLLRDGVDTVREVPKTRWDIDAYYDADPEASNKMYVRQGAFLDDGLAEGFDADFFGIAPREAVSLDPQQRLLLEVAWEALEHAGIAPDQLRTRYPKTGVYVGLMTTDYVQLSTEELDPYIGTGNELSFPSGRMSYFLGIQGPSMVVATACSSSLVSTHLACQALRNKECDMALVGGVSLMLSPRTHIVLSKMRALAPDGRCKSFSAKADGYGRGEGCGIVVLKRLSDAQAAGDKILAVIRGSAVNHDGPSGGLTVPNGPAQEKLIRQALVNAKVKPTEISYVETHGTGTALGDPLELRALGKVMGDRVTPLMIGAVKTNIGHLEAAAGVAGLIKVVLSLQHGMIPPHLHFDEPNPHIPWNEYPLKVSTELSEWPSLPESNTRIAGISSFGLSGINAHLVVEEFKKHTSTLSPPNSSSQILCLSAKSEAALEALTERYVEHLRAHEESLDWADVCFTANTGRTHFDHRLAIVAQSASEALDSIVLKQGQRKKDPSRGDALRSPSVEGQSQSLIKEGSSKPQIAFLFTGQGSQYVGMGRGLYESQPVFREALERCDEILRPYLSRGQPQGLPLQGQPQGLPLQGQPQGLPLQEILYPENVGATLAVAPLAVAQYPIHQTAYTQPALFALEYALAQMWLSWGIVPDVVMGHSVGEYVAACVAGIFSLEDGLKLIAERGRLMQALPEGEGSMAVLFADQRLVHTVIEPYARHLSMAAINGPKNVVISGRRKAVEAVVGYLDKRGIKSTTLNVSHAFHSPLMEPILRPFKQVAQSINYTAPQLTFISNLTGEVVNDALSAEYWTRHIREAVDFAAGMERVLEIADTFIEIGPNPVLLGMGRRIARAQGGKEQPWLPSLREEQDDWQQVLNSLGQLYVRGADINWAGFYSAPPKEAKPHQKVPLPTYPFQRKPYWLSESGKSKLLHSSNDWLYEIEWHVGATLAVARHEQGSGAWLIVSDGSSLGESIAKNLEKQGILCYIVKKGAGIEHIEVPLDVVIYLSSQVTVTSKVTVTSPPSPSEPYQQALEGGVSLLHLVQLLATPQGIGSTRGAYQFVKSVPKLWVVTRGAVVVPAGDKTQSDYHLADTSLWGLGKVIALEHPQLWGGLLDLEPSEHFASEASPLTPLPTLGEGEEPSVVEERNDFDTAATLLAEIMASDGENQLAYRAGQRYVARLVRSHDSSFVRAGFSRSSGTSGQPQGYAPTIKLNPEASYLITGGLGALGLISARLLVEQGARHLILTGRRGITDEAAQAAVKQLEEDGAKVDVIKADVSKPEDVVRIFAAGRSASPLGIKGIIHAAGVLDDGILLHQNVSRFEKVMAAKIKGAWNLHLLTQEMGKEGDRKGTPLQFFVMFSSAAAMLGSPGQGNYAAANAFMDGLAHYRQALGLPALSINWGPWAEVGMAAVGAYSVAQSVAQQGVSLITPAQGQQILGQLLFGDQRQGGLKPSLQAQIGILPIDWSHFPPGPFLSELQSTPKSKGTRSVRQELEAADDPQAFLLAYLQREVANVLGRGDLPEATRGFADMGMDSLMGLTLTNHLESTLEIALPATLALEYPTIEQLADYLASEILIPQTSRGIFGSQTSETSRGIFGSPTSETSRGYPRGSPTSGSQTSDYPTNLPIYQGKPWTPQHAQKGELDLFTRAAQLEALSEEEAETLLLAALAGI